MDERLHNGLSHEPFEVGARLAQPHADALDVADPELPSDEVVERNAARRQVAAGRAGREGHSVCSEVGEDFGLDQRYVAAIAAGRRVVPGAGRISIAGQPAPRRRVDGRKLLHRRPFGGRDVDGVITFRSSVKHASARWCVARHTVAGRQGRRLARTQWNATSPWPGSLVVSTAASMISNPASATSSRLRRGG